MTQVIDIEGLRFSYGTQVVVDLPHFQLGTGESMAILGASGCGKTTLLHLIAGLLQPEFGSIHILGSDITKMGGAERDRYRGQHIGMVFQRLFLMPALSVHQNLRIAQKLSRSPIDDARIDALLQELGVAEYAHRKPRLLSQGQAQRVAIARALVHSPALVLADEPTSALDDDNAQQALSLLKESTAKVGAALLVVTHDQRLSGQLDKEFKMESKF
ncbi:MAG: ABC transporter ATP-binding protein [bacterium]